MSETFFANPIESNLSRTIFEVTTAITWPAAFSNGPPELPGLIVVSVTTYPSWRFVIFPVVILPSRLRASVPGLPTAITH